MRAHLSETAYPAVRRVMGPERDVLSDDALEDLLASTFPDREPGEVEDFMSTVQRIARDAAPVVQRVAPAMAQGAMSGAAVGGPWGALIGGLGGGAASLLSSPAPGAPPQRSALAPAPVAAPVIPAAPAGNGGASAAAAAQLLTLLSRPETMHALLALLMGASGRSTVPVGERRVPATEFANAISELAGEAASSPGNAPHYYLDEEGEPRCDVFDPRARAALLWHDVSEAADAEDGWADDEEEDALDDESYESALDTFEAALAGALSR